MQTTVSIIILNYNTSQLVLNLLDQFAKAALLVGWQIIVVDNASQDNSVTVMTAQWKQIELIVSPVNRGFASGNNLGIDIATGEFVFLLNSDIIVSFEQLQQLVAYLKENENIGAVSPRLLTEKGEPQAFAYGGDPTLQYLLKRSWKSLVQKQPLHDWGVKKTIDVDWVSGACFCVRRSVIEQVGRLDSDYFLYFEDNDWCLRMRQKGWRIVYYPDVEIIHLGGKSQPVRMIANRHYYDSMELFYKKHFSLAQQVGLKLLLPLYKLLAR